MSAVPVTISRTVELEIDGEPVRVREGTTLLDKTNDGGNKVLSPYPGKDAKLLICATENDIGCATMPSTASRHSANSPSCSR